MKNLFKKPEVVVEEKLMFPFPVNMKDVEKRFGELLDNALGLIDTAPMPAKIAGVAVGCVALGVGAAAIANKKEQPKVTLDKLIEDYLNKKEKGVDKFTYTKVEDISDDEAKYILVFNGEPFKCHIKTFDGISVLANIISADILSIVCNNVVIDNASDTLKARLILHLVDRMIENSDTHLEEEDENEDED